MKCTSMRRCIIPLLVMAFLCLILQFILFLLRAPVIDNDKSTRSLGSETVTAKHQSRHEAMSLRRQNEFATDWTEVENSNRKLFLYSAYYDDRQSESQSVRIIAIVKRYYKIKKCLIYTSHNAVRWTEGEIKVIREGWDLEYSAAFVLCHYTPSSPTEVPLYVFPEFWQTDELGSPLRVTQMHNRPLEGFMSVCVKPFHYQFNRAVWLVEFIEMHRILGVEHFIFYNHTVGRDVAWVLTHYVNLGVVSVYNWSLPVESQKEIRTEGIFAALNDCNLRSVNRFQYTAFVDIDEFILPKKQTNYRTLIANLGDYDAYIFQNDFFYLYWDNDTQADLSLYENKDSLGTRLYATNSEGPYLLTAYKTTRLSRPHPHGTRSKYIAKPDKVIECGNHLVSQFVPTYHTNGFVKSTKSHYLNVNAHKGICHHYRICEMGGFDCLKAKHEIDRTAHRWLDELFARVADNCMEIFPQLGKCPIAPPLGSPY